MIRSGRLGAFLLCGMLAASLLEGCTAKPKEIPQNAGAAPAAAVASGTASPLAATNMYHGVAVADPFRWLEEGADPKVRAWSAEQNRRARPALDALPMRAEIEKRLMRLLTQSSPDYFSLSFAGGKLFALRFDPNQQQPALVLLPSLTNLNVLKAILDPNRLDASGGVSIDWYVPSHDGKRIAVSLPEGGSEAGTLYVYDAESGARLADVLPRVHGATAGGSAVWSEGSDGLFYTRYPRAGERPEKELSFYQQVYFHKLGTPAEQDRYEIGREFPRIAEITLQSTLDGRYVTASVANGDGGDYAHYLRLPSGEWRQVARFEDKVKEVAFGRDPLYIEAGQDKALYLLSFAQAPHGCILRLPFAAAHLSQAELVIPERTNSVIHDFRPAASGMYVAWMNGGPSEISYYDYTEKTFNRPRDDDRRNSSVQEMLVTKGDELLYRLESFTEPFSWMRYDRSESKNTSFETALSGGSPAPFHDVEVVHESARSKDGTTIPLCILQRRGTRRTGDLPTLLTGYGGFGISLGPSFDAARRLWIDQGGVIAIANLRGGGEFGEPWHAAGALTNKQNVFDDFAACAERLAALKYTTPAKLAFEGGSNGGLLMGAMLAQHPDLARAVVSHAGIYDMLRLELDPNGAFNTTEYGTVANPGQFQALYRYSPYHQLSKRVSYPAVLMLTGENDGRVNPAHSRKMIARLQSLTGGPNPILLRTSSNSGHGIGTALNEQIQQLADVYAFLCEQLGIDYSLVDRGPWSGAVAPDSATVKVKLIREGLRSRLAVSKSPSLTSPVFFGPAISEARQFDVVSFHPAGLEPNTQYYYWPEVEGRVDRKHGGEFKTFPAPGPASFTIAFASCGKTGSTLDTFDRIREHHPLMFLHMGDFHYLDIHSNNPALFAAAYDWVLASPQQGDLYRSVPITYIWDDHDFAGNRSDGSSPAHPAAMRAFDIYVPHYPLVFGGSEGAVNQSFSIGRVKFIMTDLRSQRDDPKRRDSARKTMMGAAQKEWFKKELLAANGKYPLICWVSSDPWLGEPRTNYYHWIKTNQYGYIHHSNYLATAQSALSTNRNLTADDHWSVYATERREIADFIKNNRIRGVCILHGDSHMLAADDGSHSDYATGGGAPLPVMCAAPLDQTASIKGGLYSQGIYRVKPGEGAFGLLTVNDLNDHLDVIYSGRNNKDEEKVTLRFSVAAEPPPALP